MSTQTGWPRRVCVVSRHNPYDGAGGASAYLDSVASLFAERGAELHLLVTDPLSPTNRRGPEGLLRRFGARYESVSCRGVLRVRGEFYALRAGPWLGLVHDRGVPGWLPPMRPDAAAWAGRRMARIAPDLVLANYFNAAPALDAAPLGAARTLLIHDVMALRAQSLAAAGVASDVRLGAEVEEEEAFARADLCLAIQEREVEHILTRAPGGLVRALPHHLDAPDLTAPPDGPRTALFVGSFFNANVDALRWLLEDIWPRVARRLPQARLRVVGRVAEAWTGAIQPSVSLEGFAPDLSEIYAGATVVAAPLRFGSGLKIKVVEALAHGVPVVTTPTGAEGMPEAPDGALQVATGAEALAEALCVALSAPDQTAPRRAARAFAASRYSSAAARTCLSEVLDALARRLGK